MNPDSIRIAIFGVHSADAINPDSIRIEVLVRTHLRKKLVMVVMGKFWVSCSFVHFYIVSTQ